MDNFLDRYIFPGGYLASVARLFNAIEVGSKSDLEIECVQSIGPHYIKTLRSWRDNFLRNWPAIREEYEESRKGKGDSDRKVTEHEIEAWRRRCECIPCSLFSSGPLALSISLSNGICLEILTDLRDILLLILRSCF